MFALFFWHVTTSLAPRVTDSGECTFSDIMRIPSTLIPDPEHFTTVTAAAVEALLFKGEGINRQPVEHSCCSPP